MSLVLLVTPVPTHPQEQGNSARIFRLGKLLQSIGHQVHLLYYGMEGLTSEQRVAMTREWNGFTFITARGQQLLPSFESHYHLDDWYDPIIGETIRELCKRWKFSACIVNYVWLSRALLALPNDVARILDTHDVFGDRHLAAQAQGIEPSWYYTSLDEESRGITRADVVIAIQPSEQAYFDKIGAHRTAVVGYLSPAIRVPKPPPHPKLRLGYLASANPFNINAIESLIAAIPASLINKIELLIGGGICSHLTHLTQNSIRLLGRVEQPLDLYRQVDVLVNPMRGGTGLKIKTVEALAYGLPTICTADASIGIDQVPPWMNCDTPKAMIDWIAQWQQNPTLCATASDTSRAVFQTYWQTQQQNALALFQDFLILGAHRV